MISIIYRNVSKYYNGERFGWYIDYMGIVRFKDNEAESNLIRNIKFSSDLLQVYKLGRVKCI